MNKLVLSATLLAPLLVSPLQARAADDQAAACAEAQSITYMDSKVFDAGMDQVLRRGCAQVDVQMFSEVKFDKLPARIDDWLERIVAAGGGLTVLQQEKPPTEEIQVSSTRGGALSGAVVSEVAGAVTMAYGYIKKINDVRLERDLRKAAGEYTAILYVDKAKGVVTGMRLVRGDGLPAEAAPEEIGK